MKLYEISEGEDGPTYATAMKQAISDAKLYSTDDVQATVDRIDIGPLTKATACALANGSGFVRSRERVWPKPPR